MVEGTFLKSSRLNEDVPHRSLQGHAIVSCLCQGEWSQPNPKDLESLFASCITN